MLHGTINAATIFRATQLWKCMNVNRNINKNNNNTLYAWIFAFEVRERKPLIPVRTPYKHIERTLLSSDYS